MMGAVLVSLYQVSGFCLCFYVSEEEARLPEWVCAASGVTCPLSLSLGGPSSSTAYHFLVSFSEGTVSNI